MSDSIPTVLLNNGLAIPQLGLGTWQAAEGGEVVEAVKKALGMGYRLIDTARIYGNENGVGQAIRESGLPREDVFVTTKLWNDDHDFDAALDAFDASLERLGLDYLDLYLIHWPSPRQGKFTEAWRALEKLYKDKRVRAIGVCNFKPHHLEELLGTAEVVPAINQIELHPYLQQKETRDYCARYGIQIESYSPIQRAGELLRDPDITNLADKHGKTPAQIVLRWHVQSGFVTIPKSVNANRQRENLDIFDFELDQADMSVIAGLDRSQRIGTDPDS